MREFTNAPLTGVEPQTLELSSNLSKEVRESTACTTTMEVKNISHNRHFGIKRGKVPVVRDLNRFLADYQITTPHIGQVPEQPTRMQEKRKATFVNRATISGRPSWLHDRRALPVTGTWPTLSSKRSNMNRSFLQEGESSATLEF